MSAPGFSRLRPTLVLCAFALLLSVVSAFALLPPGTVPGAGVIDPLLLPHFLTGAALLFAALGAPAVFRRSERKEIEWTVCAGRAGVAALWCGVIAGFMLLVCARIAPLQNAGILQAAMIVTTLCGISILLDAAFPRAAFGLLFAWCVAPPVSAYMLAEVFLMTSAGGGGLAQSAGPQVIAVREVLRWLLNASPGTAAFGALNDGHPGGIDYSPLLAAGAMVLVALLALFAVRRAGLNRPLPQTL